MDFSPLDAWRSVPFRQWVHRSDHCVSSSVVPRPGPSGGRERNSAFGTQAGKKKKTALRLRERSLIICLTASHVASWNTLCYLARHFGPATLKIASFLDSMFTLFGFTSNSPVGPETLSWSQFCFRTRSGALDKQTRSFDESISLVSCGGAARRGGQDKQRRRNLKDHLLRELAPRACLFSLCLPTIACIVLGRPSGRPRFSALIRIAAESQGESCC